MATFLVHTFALTGSMNAILPLATALRERGHRIVFAGFPAVRARVEAQGYEYLPLFGRWLGDEGRRRIRRAGGWAGLARARRRNRELEPLLADLLTGRNTELDELYAELRPDLTLVQASNFYAPLWALAARGHGVPAIYLCGVINHSVSPRVPPAWTHLPPGDSPGRRARVLAAWTVRLIGRNLATRLYARMGFISDPFRFFPRLARRWGYPPERLRWRSYVFPELDLPKLFEGPAAFDFAAETPDARHLGLLTRAGEAVGEEDRRLLAELDAEPSRPLVYCSLGSLDNLPPESRRRFFAAVLEAIAVRPALRLLLSLSRQLPADALPAVPANARVVEWAPQMEVLARASLMLHHGGLSSALECLACGVPAAAFPIGFDQPGVAARIVYHGVGLRGDVHRASAEEIGSMIDVLLGDPGYRARTEALRRESAARGETSRALAWIEELAAGSAWSCGTTFKDSMMPMKNPPHPGLSVRLNRLGPTFLGSCHAEPAPALALRRLRHIEVMS